MTDNKMDKGRKSFFFKRNKELITFLPFLLFAILMWFVNNMSRTIETEVKIPIVYEAVPQDIVISSKLPDSLQVTVRDQGQVLYGYAVHRLFHPEEMTIPIDLMEWKHSGGVARIRSKQLMSKTSGWMKPSTEILKISPDTITVSYLVKDSKEVPVRLNSDIHLSRQYILTGEPRITPSSVMIYAPKGLLDKIDEVETELMEVDNYRDSATFTVSLKAIDGVQFSEDEIEVSLFAEPFTETSVSVPVCGSNIPRDCQLRTFPSHVEVTFIVRESQYGMVDAEDFTASVELPSASVELPETGTDNSNSLLPVVLTQCPQYAVRPQIAPDRVESLLEKKK